MVFDALLEARNISRVARDLGLTQSAIRHAVARLRDVFADPLFVRGRAGVEPTPRAVALGDPIAAAPMNVREAIEFGQAHKLANPQSCLG